MRQETTKFRKNFGLPLFFLLLICLPLADMLFHIQSEIPIREKRKLAAKPRFDWRKPCDFPAAYDRFFNDHFGFRTQLVHYHNLLAVDCLNASPTDKVVVGRQGWLFMGRETERRDEMEYFRALKPFTPAELRRWRLVLRQRRQWLAERGATYLLLVIPNKSTIYPEYLPAHIRRWRRQSRLDQLLAELGQEGDFPIIDLRETLLAAKRSHRLYNKTDSHWNELGAYFAFAKIMEKLAPVFPNLEKPSLNDFTIESSDRAGGDLAQMLSLQKKHLREQVIRLRPKIQVEVQTIGAKKKLGPYIRETISACPSASLPGLLMVHDSFAHQLKPLLNARFRRIFYIWDWGLHFFSDVIEKEKPAIVIDEIAERMLCDLTVANPPNVNDPAGR